MGDGDVQMKVAMGMYKCNALGARRKVGCKSENKKLVLVHTVMGTTHVRSNGSHFAG